MDFYPDFCIYICILIILYIILFSLFHQADKSGDNALSFDEFQQSLKEMDKNLTQLPPTAQVNHSHVSTSVFYSLFVSGTS